MTKFLAGLALGTSLLASLTAQAAPALVNALSIPMGTDLSGEPSEGAQNRLGGIFSDLYYDRHTGYYYALGDRGPGGGVLPYAPRINKFALTVDPVTGAASNFVLVDTIVFKQTDGSSFTGLNPSLDPDNGSKSVLGGSFDPEGLTMTKNGHFLVADEYGPSIKEFDAGGKLVRTFSTPENLLPKQGATLNYVDGRGTITTGRQDNRGFEGLTITPDGKYALAVLQDPLVNEGTDNGTIDGRRSRNVRIVKFDVASGEAVGQYIYQLDARADINANVPGHTFSGSAQGRNIGLSAIIAINDHEFLVIERDNRGLGVENADLTDGNDADFVGIKRIYKIDITGATDVSGIDLTNTNTLPGGVSPVSKVLFLDLAAALNAAGLPITEKMEGITFGEFLNDGSLSFLMGIDNDFSVTQTGSGTQYDVCAGPTFAGATAEFSNTIPLGGTCPDGTALIDNWLYAFTLSAQEVAGLNFVPQERVPVPAAALLFGAGLAGVAALRRTRRSR